MIFVEYLEGPWDGHVETTEHVIPGTVIDLDTGAYVIFQRADGRTIARWAHRNDQEAQT